MVKSVMKKKTLLRILGIFLFAIGVVVGMVLFGVSTWADLEAAFYGFGDMGGKRLSTLECPILMTKTEIGSVQAEFKNPNKTPIEFMVRADFSSTSEIRIERSMLTLNAHQSKNVVWHMTSQDIDLGNFIFVQVSNYPANSIPFRQATCGVVVLNMPQFTGSEIFTFAMIVVLGGIVLGLYLWETYSQPLFGKLQDTSRAMKTLGVLVLLGMLVSFQGTWVFGVLLFAASVLAIGVIIGFFLSQ
jgi:hypothetical protein